MELIVVQDEFQVNQSWIDNQDHATVATNQTGTSLIVWHDYGSIDGDGTAAVGRFFDGSGTPLAGEFLLNETVTGNQRVPSVATNNNDLFVVVWSSGSSLEGYNVFFKLLSSTGQVLIGETKVNDTPSTLKTWPDAAMYKNGDFIVIWDQVNQGALNFYVKQYNALGGVLLGPYRINTTPSDTPPDPNSGAGYGLPDIDVNENGDALAVWERIAGGGVTVVGRLIRPYARKVFQEFLVDQPAIDIVQRRPILDLNEAGDFVVTWVEYSTVNPLDGNVIAKKYFRSTSRWGDRISPHANTGNNQHRSTVKLSENGQFVLAWTSYDPVWSDDVYMRFYSGRGVPLSNEILVNTERGNSQQRPAIDWSEYPNHISMTVTWESVAQDGSGNGIFKKLYGINY